MNIVELYGLYRYLGIEEDFIKAQYYVSFENQNAFSEFFTREVILLGTEIEAAFKELCYRIKGETPGNIGQYKEIILCEYPNIVNIGVKNIKTNVVDKPFSGWDTGNLEWWDKYTGVKHNLVDKEATIHVAVTMLQAYLLLLFCISATAGIITIEYRDAPKLYSPLFNPGFRLTANMKAEYGYAQDEIIRKLKGVKSI